MLLTACGSVSITVNTGMDGQANAANCQSTAIGACSLRSAFELCLSLGSSEECVINLPVGEDIVLDIAYGGRLAMTSACNILIRGNNATVSRIGSTELATVELGGSFPMSTGTMTNTASATKNYKSACTEGCGGDVLAFTGCNYGTTQDTYYRLYKDSTQVAQNDDYCGAVSYIQYSIADGTACAQYCLRAGCYSSGTCTTTVQAFATRYTPFNFVYYQQSAGDTSVPRLAMEDLTISGFDGAVRLVGDVQLIINRVIFIRNLQDEGGAIFLDYNAQPVRVADCVFTDGEAQYGAGSVAICMQLSTRMSYFSLYF